MARYHVRVFEEVSQKFNGKFNRLIKIYESKKHFNKAEHVTRSPQSQNLVIECRLMTTKNDLQKFLLLFEATLSFEV